MTLLKLNSINLDINGKSILKDISLEVRKGEIVAITGESGSGKSMTALSIMQLLPIGSVQNGSIFLEDTNLISLTESELCSIRGNQIGMIFQEPMTALNPLKTIGNQIAETVKLHKAISHSDAIERVKSTMRLVEMPPEKFPLYLYPHQLSGGQRQRVVIAMAIISRPKLLIADEPTTALDVTTQSQILTLLKELVTDLDMGMIMMM